ncbi:hypothetical protein [Streptomyces sp. WMMB 322]|uniref:hypothetical protein n=1 Tax=Streptomyces sp. WMMB 322 TaxID=1286821 RepID=UPI000823A296|nr:hypothetical protein [Streptomyces sp. WMMB 322]SCK39925.1 hypothetical protein H180DRAFT_03415 [Streptomyces sp. WMMB 322]
MERVVQFTGPRQVDIAEHERAPLPSGHVRLRTSDAYALLDERPADALQLVLEF